MAMDDDLVDAAAETAETNGEAATAAHQTRAEADAAARAAFMALEDGEGEDGGEEKPAAVPKKPAAKPAGDAEDTVEGAADDDDELDDIDLDDDEVDETDDDDDEIDPKADPDLAKRMAKVRKAEQRNRDQFATRARQLEAKAQELGTELKRREEKVAPLERFIEQRDFMGVLKVMGYSDDDLEDVSKIVYGHSKAAAADPKNKGAVRQLQENRQLRDRLSELEKRDADRAAENTRRDAQVAAERQAEQYMGKVAKTIGDDVPLTKKRLEARPESTRKQLSEIAYKLALKNGNEPVAPAKVVKVYERKLERDRVLYGDAESAPAGGKKPAAKGSATTAGGKKPAIEVVEAPKKKSTNIIPTREEALAMIDKYERGELTLDDPD